LPGSAVRGFRNALTAVQAARSSSTPAAAQRSGVEIGATIPAMAAPPSTAIRA
jgi:hypothetical protein